MLDVEVAGERVVLSGERALWWPARRTLVVADLHLGKAASFRHAGIPVPEHTTGRDLDRLSQAATAHGAERLVILGDLLHAPTGRSAGMIDEVARWRAACPGLEIVLVRGNHDRRSGDPPPEWRMHVVGESLVDGPFVYRHEPAVDERGYVLCGHLHPAAVLVGGASRLRAPCFWMGPRVGVLPAFGSFTGMSPIRAEVGDRVYVVGDGRVMQAPTRKRRAARSPGKCY